MTLNKVVSFALLWLVNFSPAKTESLIISNKHNLQMHPPLQLNNVIISEASAHKHLGLTVSSNLWWHSHVNDIYTKAMKRLDIIQAFKFKLSRTL